jgi:hypothetical protein
VCICVCIQQGKILDKIQEWRDKYGPVFRVWYERYKTCALSRVFLALCSDQL